MLTPGRSTKSICYLLLMLSVCVLYCVVCGRDWGNVFSPPIVLPSAIQNGNTTQALVPTQLRKDAVGTKAIHG